MAESLIIRSTYSRLPDGSLKSNLGDLLRSTVLLECIGNSFLWLTDERGKSLLKWFVERENIITFDDDIDNREVSTDVGVYNIDNYICNYKLFNRLNGNWRGFIRNGKDRVRAENRIIAMTEPYCEVESETSFQQALVEGMGFRWKEQDYAPCRIEQETITDVGLNRHVHPEWKSKCWPEENWEKLAEILRKRCSVSWQKGINNFDEYVDWLASCRVIVTQDTLGLHLASALRKRVVAVVGPTENREFPYNRVVSLKPDPRDCMPCNLPACKAGAGKECLSEITVECVADTVTGVLFGLNLHPEPARKN